LSSTPISANIAQAHVTARLSKKKLEINRLSRNTITLLTSNVGSAALSFILSVLIGRVLKQEGLGVYTAALAWVFPLSLIAEFGLGSLMTRDIAQNPDSADEYLRSTTSARLWLGGGLMLALVIFAPLLSDDPAVIAGLRISAPLIVILPFFGAFTAIFRAKQAMWPIPPLNLGMLVAQVVLTIAVFLAGGGVLAALVVNTLTSAGQLVAAWAVWRWKFYTPMRARHVAPLQIIVLLRRAWPFALAAVLAALQTRAGTILLEKLTDTAQVGYYAAGTRFVEAARMIPNALFGALFPALAALAAQQEALQRTFRKVMLGLGGFGFALGTGFLLFAAPIMNLTYGAVFEPAIPVLQIAMWSLLPGLLRAGRTLYWYAQGREQFTNIVTGVALVVQIILSLWLIPLHGASGAAIVSLVTETLALLLLWWPAAKKPQNA
jgi:O-antigen/teichoic acid export membrane protein